ncbi:sodium-translocating pyrophosphatase [Candidatus Woesearchaeota archaeon]|jgi:K(+)-stimulated pyrophosphate-energized sodium pump|nr:sodium-translocating pyrophosphatase [Candidatus Woesearchaeota archaeon]MDP6648015.1 sodium-translocating pyrophosphatase [Candidatus Woesearchaeota archaeon]|tara:strand:- start:51451 stop:53415 length:1965 start_codon:yes stop_codon:yes gene_type:complete
MGLLIAVIIISILALIFAAFTASRILKQDAGNQKIKEIADAIHQGAMTFLHKEYKILVIFVIVVALVLWFAIPQTGPKLAVSFVAGSILSALAGNIGMRIATKSNSRTAVAAKKSISKGLKIAFSSGVVMGLSVVGLGLLGVTALYLIFDDPNIIFGFGFGASSIALFARVGGGIYTKAADVGADLVGKVEKGIPEDDPRNPAVIADNVGDNVGDVAGMGADLFESYVDNIIAAMVLGVVAFSVQGIKLPLALAAFGIVSAILGTYFVKAAKKKHLHTALNKGIFASSVIMLIGSFFIVKFLVNDVGIFFATVAGLIAGIIIGVSTEYFTSSHRKPTISIAEASKTGSATNIIQGLSVGMMSTVIPVIAVSAAILISFKFGGLFGIAIAGVGMLSTLGITLASDTYGPVADNAAGIAEMGRMGKEVRKRAEALDAVGNTTAAIGKGFAIGSAALTALALFASYMTITGLTSIDIGKPLVIVGLFIGALMPFLFSSLTMKSVGNAAFHIINEVRRQFKEIKGLMKGTAKPDYNKCIAISTHAALKEMILPSLIAIITPVLFGYLFGAEALGGLLAGVTVTGFLMAVFLSNSGGAWDNAKKYIEEGHLGGKGSDAHKAAVVGDTVGDPCKDTSGPSLNILIKLMSIVSLVFVPLFL